MDIEYRSLDLFEDHLAWWGGASLDWPVEAAWMVGSFLTWTYFRIQTTRRPSSYRWQLHHGTHLWLKIHIVICAGSVLLVSHVWFTTWRTPPDRLRGCILRRVLMSGWWFQLSMSYSKENKKNDQQPQRQEGSVYFDQRLLLMTQLSLAMPVCEQGIVWSLSSTSTLLNCRDVVRTKKDTWLLMCKTLCTTTFDSSGVRRSSW